MTDLGDKIENNKTRKNNFMKLKLLLLAGATVISQATGFAATTNDGKEREAKAQQVPVRSHLQKLQDDVQLKASVYNALDIIQDTFHGLKQTDPQFSQKEYEQHVLQAIENGIAGQTNAKSLVKGLSREGQSQLDIMMRIVSNSVNTATKAAGENDVRNEFDKYTTSINYVSDPDILSAAKSDMERAEDYLKRYEAQQKIDMHSFYEQTRLKY